VRPDHATICKVDPLPFHTDDLRHARRKGELQTDPEAKERMLQPFHIRALEIAKKSGHFFVGDQPRLAALRIFWDVAARISALVAEGPNLGHAEHLTEARQ